MRIWAIPILGWAALLASAANAREPILYTLSVAPDHTLRVEIRLRGDADGETEIGLPDRWAGTNELWRGVSAFEAEGGTVSGTNAIRIVRHRPNARLVLRYRVSGETVPDTSEKARPVIESSWFFFHGEGVFAIPAGREQAPVRFRWGAIPAGWKVASDLDHMTARDGRLDDVSESVGLGGSDVTVLHRAVDGAPLRLVIRGAWSFAPDDMLGVVARIMRAEHGYWRDPPRPFIIAMAPLPPLGGGAISYTGTGRGDGFSILSTPGFDLKQAIRTLAHEYMHHWVANRLGGLPAEREGREFWFSEGFDDYLTARVLLGSGIWSFDDYFTDKNQVLLRYATSPARAATADAIAAKFWLDDDFERISYDRGHLLALRIDARIRQTSRGRISLDDVLRAQERSVIAPGTTAAALFPEVLRRTADLDMTAEIDREMKAGDPFLLPTDAFGGCARIETQRRRAFTRGFDADATAAAGMIVKGVDPSGPAYAAGMRDGMKLVRREHGVVGDSTAEIAYRVVDGGAERVIAYMPQGKAEFDVQHIVPTIAGAAEEIRCRALLGGAA